MQCGRNYYWLYRKDMLKLQDGQISSKTQINFNGGLIKNIMGSATINYQRRVPMKTRYLIVLLLAFVSGFTTFSYAQESGHRVPYTIFNNGNSYGVMNNPTAPTIFHTRDFYRITNIMTYHWNDGYGQPSGTIAIVSQNGTVYGPWYVTTAPGQGGVPNAYWHAYPNVVIPPGTYAINDSSPDTWAQNDASGGKGMAEIKGFRILHRR